MFQMCVRANRRFQRVGSQRGHWELGRIEKKLTRYSVSAPACALSTLSTPPRRGWFRCRRIWSLGCWLRDSFPATENPNVGPRVRAGAGFLGFRQCARPAGRVLRQRLASGPDKPTQPDGICHPVRNVLGFGKKVCAYQTLATGLLTPSRFGFAESNIQIRHFQRILLDELAPWLNLIAHQRGEHLVGGDGIFNPDLQQPAGVGIQRCFP